MGHHYDAGQLQALSVWTHQAAAELGVEPLNSREVELLLAASARASSQLVRSAGPVTMFLAGMLLGGGEARDVATACERVEVLLFASRDAG